MDVPKPIWTTGSFLLYTGGLTVLGAAVASLSYLSGSYGDAAFLGWSALVFAVLAAAAWRFRRAGRWIAAGVFALLAVAAFGVVVGALETWWGWLPKHPTPFGGFHAGRLLLDLLVLAASLAAMRIFRFPFLALPAFSTAWYLVTDAVSGGGDWSAIVTIFVGVVFLLIGTSLDRGPRRPYGFWAHLAAGLTIGGSALFFWHSSDGDWALVCVTALVFVALAAGVGRSSWAFLGAAGLLLAGGHFAAQWGHVPLVFVDPSDAGTSRGWVPGLVFAFVGFLLVLCGLIFERRRRPLPAG
ncbi:MAG: hypothetical protein V7644_422 [Actinomycetota bacterium]|jgi:hypothetical protein